MISFACPDCGHVGKARDEFAGKRVTCPACQSAFRVRPAITITAKLPADDSVSSSPEWLADPKPLPLPLPRGPAPVEASPLNRSVPRGVSAIVIIALAALVVVAGLIFWGWFGIAAPIAGGVLGLIIFFAGMAHLGRSSTVPTRTCPHCAERIRPQARVCRFCGRDVAGFQARRLA